MAFNEIVSWIKANANDITESGDPAYTETINNSELSLIIDSQSNTIEIQVLNNSGSSIAIGSIDISENDAFSFVFQGVYNPQIGDFDCYGTVDIYNSIFDSNYPIDFKTYRGDSRLRRSLEGICSATCCSGLLWLNQISNREQLGFNCAALGFYSID